MDYTKLIDFLYEENLQYNLTGIKEKKDMYTKHILDSLFLSDYITINNLANKELLDIGTGAGFPAIVLAKELLNIKVFALDSVRKKTLFVDKVINKFKIANLFSHCDRVETYALQNKNRFSLVTARSVAGLNVLLEYAAPLLMKGGSLLAMKSIEIEEELLCSKETQTLTGLEFCGNFSYTLSDQKRHILAFRKINEPEVCLPRKIGLAKNQPLRR